MDAEKCLLGRRSIRRFKPYEIDNETIEKLIHFASYAPSWANSQCVRYIAVKDEAMKDKLAEIRGGGNAEVMRQSSVVFVLCALPGKSGMLGKTPTVKGEGWKYFDCGGSAQTLCLDAYAMGLGSLQMGAFDYARVAEALSLPEELEVVEMIAVGMPDIAPDAPQRLPVSELVKII